MKAQLDAWLRATTEGGQVSITAAQSGKLQYRYCPGLCEPNKGDVYDRYGDIPEAYRAYFDGLIRSCKLHVRVTVLGDFIVR